MNTKHRICVTARYYLYYTCNPDYCRRFSESAEFEMNCFEFAALLCPVSLYRIPQASLAFLFYVGLVLVRIHQVFDLG
jgi:hypothetical protein